MGLLSKLEKGSEIYAENTALRALITAIPHIGGSIDIIFASKAIKLIEERLIYLLARLRVEMKSLKEGIVDKDYLESDEFFDLVMRLMDASAKTCHKEKIDIYAKLLTNSVAIQGREEFSPEDYLNILIELTPREIDVAKIIYEKEEEIAGGHSAGKMIIDLKKLSEYCHFVPKEDLRFILIRLMRVGLLSPTTGWFADVEYVITEVFRKIMQYLEIK